MSNNAERMTKLCQSMPYLANKTGFGLGWDTAVAFEGEAHASSECAFPGWASGSRAAREAVRFARHVWNAEHPAPSLAYWDETHRTGFVAWASNPWWC